MAKILLIEDEQMIQELLTFNLTREGYDVKVAGDGKKGLEMVYSERPDLIILDVMLPVLDGYEVCKTIRGNNESAKLPIIMLSARDEVTDKVIGLELGADDYVTKPFSTRELLARVKARFREGKRSSGPEKSKSLQWDELEIWPDSYLATLAGENLNLTAKEFELLHIFLTRSNQVFSREYLMQKVWGYQSSGDTRTVDVHVSNLRSKLKSLGTVIESVRGIGYRFSSSQPSKS